MIERFARLAIFMTLAIGLAWFFRYDIEQVAPGRSYVLDRWTGEVSYIFGTEITSVTRRDDTKFDPSTARIAR